MREQKPIYFPDQAGEIKPLNVVPTAPVGDGVSLVKHDSSEMSDQTTSDPQNSELDQVQPPNRTEKRILAKLSNILLMVLLIIGAIHSGMSYWSKVFVVLYAVYCMIEMFFESPSNSKDLKEEIQTERKRQGSKWDNKPIS